MDYAVIFENLPIYLDGLWMTIQLVFISLISGFGLAVPIALMAVSNITIIRYL